MIQVLDANMKDIPLEFQQMAMNDGSTSSERILLVTICNIGNMFRDR